MDGGYDAAFGPMGALSSQATFTPPERIKDVQRALNALGYGPLEVDGIMGPKTNAAVSTFTQSTGTTATGNQLWDQIVNAASKKAEQAGKPTAPSLAPVAQPFYKNPWVLGTVALAAVAGYIAWRASGKSAGAVSGHDEEAEGKEHERRERRGRKAKRSLGDEKCGRTPMAGFEDGEPVELEAPEYAEKVED